MTDWKELDKVFDRKVIKQLSKGGTKLDYVPIAEVIARLNSVVGHDNWGEEDTEVWRDSANPEWVLARTTVWVLRDDGIKVTKIGYGGQKIKTTKAGDIVDLGDEYKGAHSDAFKKACTKLGIALHLARDDEAMRQQVVDEERRELEASPQASDDVIQTLTEALNSKTAEEKDAVRDLWIKHSFPSLTSGKITEGQAATIGTWLGIKLEL